jgi:rRNA-processing protein FCF1
VDDARWGGGPTIEAIHRGSANHINDSLIGVTAEAENAILITNERRLTNRARELDIPVMTMPDLLRDLGIAVPDDL